jgi:hypothetical protein
MRPTKPLEKKFFSKQARLMCADIALADHYRIDLSNIPVVATAGPLTHDKGINERQWAHVRALGAEWATKDSKGAPFRLIPDDSPVRAAHRMLDINNVNAYIFSDTYCRPISTQVVKFRRFGLKLHATGGHAVYVPYFYTVYRPYFDKAEILLTLTALHVSASPFPIYSHLRKGGDSGEYGSGWH